MNLNKKICEFILMYVPYFYDTDVYSIIDSSEYEKFIENINVVNLSPEDDNPAYLILPLGFKVDEEFAKKLRKYYNLLEIHHFVKEVYNLLYRKYASELEVGDTEAWYMAKVFDTYGIKATTIKVVYSMLNLVIVKEEFGDKVIYKVFKEGRVGYYKSLPVDY